MLKVKEFLRRLRRKWLANQIVENGDELSALYRERGFARVDYGAGSPYTQHIDSEITRRERRSDQLLTRFKEAH